MTRSGKSSVAAKHIMFEEGSGVCLSTIAYSMCGRQFRKQVIYYCEALNGEEEKKNIHTGNLSEETKVFRRFEINMKSKNQIRLMRDEQKKSPSDQSNDPLDCIQYSIG